MDQTRTMDARCEIDIRRGVMANRALKEKHKLLTTKNLGLQLKLRKKISRTCMWSVALNGSKIWTLDKCDEKRMEAFEMCC